jgi:hypothetical protein
MFVWTLYHFLTFKFEIKSLIFELLHSRWRFPYCGKEPRISSPSIITIDGLIFQIS